MRCGPADGDSGPAVLAACAARRWLARSAGGIKAIGTQTAAAAPACTRLVCCLPALEDVDLNLGGPVGPYDLRCLLEALAWCPRLEMLSLNMHSYDRDWGEPDPYTPFPAQALASLSSLTWLLLYFSRADPYTLVDVLGALVPLTGLTELYICFSKPTVPAALGQLKGLRVLGFKGLRFGVLEPGCLDLPDLRSLDFKDCMFADADALPNVSALQRLTCFEFSQSAGPLVVDSWLVQLCGLQRFVFSQDLPFEHHGDRVNPPGPLRLPADMGSLSSTLLHLDVSGQIPTRIPLAVTQLVALEHLNAKDNAFTELPAGITALLQGSFPCVRTSQLCT